MKPNSLPREIRMMIRPNDNRYTCNIDGLAQFPINLSLEDVKKLNQKIKKALNEMSNEFIDNVRLGQTESINALKALATQGAIAAEKIFGQNWERVRKRFRNNSIIVLHVDAKDFVVPWELLYENFQLGKLERNSFWGYKYIIERTFPPKTDRDSFFDSTILVKNLPRLGLVADATLKHVADTEIPMFNQLKKDKAIYLIKLRNLDSQNRDNEIGGQLLRFLDGSLHVLHFACHAEPAVVGESESEFCLILPGEFKFCPDDFIAYGVKMSHAPLVVLNACDTDIRDPSQTFSLVESLHEHGARGVVATESEVPDFFASEFAKQFYTRFLSGEILGLAILGARKYFAKKPFRNPLGLLYSMYADYDLKIERSKTNAAQIIAK